MQILPLSEFNRAAYLGKWYQFANTKQFYQPAAAYNVSALYLQEADGRISVSNTLFVNGKEKNIQGTLIETSSPRVFRVKLDKVFLGISITGDYAIPVVITDKKGKYLFAVVGKSLTDRRGYFYILSRKQNVTCEEQRYLFALLEKLGYDLNRLLFTPQICTTMPL